MRVEEQCDGRYNASGGPKPGSRLGVLVHLGEEIEQICENYP